MRQHYRDVSQYGITKYFCYCIQEQIIPDGTCTCHAKQWPTPPSIFDHKTKFSASAECTQYIGELPQTLLCENIEHRALFILHNCPCNNCLWRGQKYSHDKLKSSEVQKISVDFPVAHHWTCACLQRGYASVYLP